MLRLNLWYNRASAGGESRQRAAKARIKRQIKSAVHYLIDFRDEAVTRAALGRKVDGVICGHTHHPDHRMIGPLLYINDGDWVQSRTALVEEADGALKLLRWEKTPTENQNEVDA
jgi:UDP-2,3-diacylglucosamine pyrophosphatase LpxH